MANLKKNQLNQVLFVLVDPTDFASIKSALTNVPTGKYYGVAHGGSAATTSGALSKAISHVHSGIYRATLKAAETNYDYLLYRFLQPSAADQVLTFQAVDNDDSDILSALTVIQSMASDAASAAQQANSRVLVVQSQASDAYSAIIAPLASMTSDVASAVWAHALGVRVDSRILVAQSYLSDIRSHVSDLQSDFQSRVPKAVASQSLLSDVESNLRSLLVAGITVSASDMSDIRSAIAAGPAATITQSDISNIASAVWGEKYHNHSLASSFGSLFSVMATTGNQANSRLLVNQSTVSDIRSQLTAGIPLDASTMSDIRSAITGVTATVTASDISDIASAVWANTIGARVDSRILVNKSVISDLYSLASDLQSDFQSRVTKKVATDSALSDLASDLRSVLIVNQSAISDLISKLSDVESNLLSVIGTTGVQINASSLSDLRSAIAAGPAGVLTTSDISDVASAVWANTIGARVDSRVLVNKSAISDIYSQLLLVASNISDVYSAAAASPTLSDIASAVNVELGSRLSDILSAAVQVNSRALVIQSQTSDLASKLSDVESNLLSLLGTTGIQLNASTLSDIRSAITAGPTGVLTASDISDIVSAMRVNLASDLSDILSAATQVNSRVLVAQSYLSDIRSHVSDLQSDFQSRVGKAVATNSQLSDLASDIKSLITLGVTIGASDMSDLRSAIAAGPTGGITVSDISDIASAVYAKVASDLSDILSAAVQINSRVLVSKSTVSDIYSLLSDLQSDFQSRVTKKVATDSQLSDMASDIKSAVTIVQSMASDAASAAQQANSRTLVLQSNASDIYSLLANVGVGVSGISDIASAVWAWGGTEPTAVIGATGTMGATLDWLRALARNKITQTATLQKLRNDADNATIASAAVADDGTTATRNEWS